MGFIFFFSTTPCGVDRNGDEYIFNPTKSRSLDFFCGKTRMEEDHDSSTNHIHMSCACLFSTCSHT